MRILYVSNWSLTQGIAQATVRPMLELLERSPLISQILLCSMEAADAPPSTNGKILHFPIAIKPVNSLLLNLEFSLAIKKIVANNHVDMIWCKGSTAGAIGLVASTLTGLPLVVDSFEPHAEYMKQAGLWRRFSAKYIIQAMLERVIRRKAAALMPVTRAYEAVLRKRAVPEKKLFVVPCVVDRHVFRFDPIERELTRNRLGISSETIVGVYVGKYGGLYYDGEAFAIYRKAFEFWGDRFFLLLITESNPETIRRMIKQFELPAHRILITSSTHTEIPIYLSAADFAFSTIKSNEAMAHCSPIKHGEYWACGLPILSTLLHGDDAEIIRNQEGGVLLDLSRPDFKRTFEIIQEMFRLKSRRHFSVIAEKYRDVKILESSVKFVLSLPQFRGFDRSTKY